MSAENKALTRRLDEQVGNEGNLDIIDEIMAPDFVAHVGGAPAALRGSAAVRDWAALWRTAFPDVHATVEDVIAEHEKVVTRITFTGTHQGPLMGVLATGKSGKLWQSRSTDSPTESWPKYGASSTWRVCSAR